MKNIFLTSTIIIAMASMSNGQTPINLGFDPADPNPPVTPPVEYVPQEFINFNMDGGRDWKLEQKGVGASSSLQLRPMVQGKSFQIVAPNQSHHILNVRIQDSYLNSTVGIGTDKANTRLHVKGNARLLRLEGTDHAYQDWVAAGKTTHVGFASSGAASTGAWSIVNNFSNGKIAIDAGTNGFIDLKSNTQVLGDFTVNGGTSTLNSNTKNNGDFEVIGRTSLEKVYVKTDLNFDINGISKMKMGYHPTLDLGFFDLIGRIHYRNAANTNLSTLVIQDNGTMAINVPTSYSASNYDTFDSKLYVNGKTRATGFDIGTESSLIGQFGFSETTPYVYNRFQHQMHFQSMTNNAITPLLLQANGTVCINMDYTNATPDENFIDTQNNKLMVNGGILCESITVITDVPSSDYVFENEYDLKSLTEVEEFIKKNHHLPEVPSAQSFKENGYKIGEMDDLLLRKVEELTLYVIELNKQNKALEMNNQALNHRISELEK